MMSTLVSLEALPLLFVKKALLDFIFWESNTSHLDEHALRNTILYFLNQDFQE